MPEITSQKRIAFWAFFLLLLVIFLQLVRLFDLFLIPILWAVILAIVFAPVYGVLLKVLRKKTLASLVTTLIVVVVTLGPIVFFSGTLLNEAIDFYKLVAGWIEAGRYQTFWDRLIQSPFGGLWNQFREKTAALNIQIVPVTIKFFEKLTNTIAGQLQTGAKNFLVFVFDYVVTILAFFFFMRDGQAMVKGISELFPMSPEHKETILGRLEQTVTAVVRGIGITGITQGILAGLAFWALGVPYPVFLGFMTAFLAFFPIGGAVMIWLPSSFYLFFSDHWGKALALFLWGVLVISMVDNFLKPILIGEKVRLPTLFLFFSILGGLSFYGFIGVFLGPVILTLFLTLIQIYRKEYGTNPEVSKTPS